MERHHKIKRVFRMSRKLCSHRRQSLCSAQARGLSNPHRHVVGGPDREGDYLLISISEATQFLLTSGVPNVHKNGSEIGEELEGMDLDAHGGHIALLELARDVALDKGGLSDTTIADEDDLECGDVRRRGCHCVV